MQISIQADKTKTFKREWPEIDTISAGCGNAPGQSLLLGTYLSLLIYQFMFRIILNARLY